MQHETHSVKLTKMPELFWRRIAVRGDCWIWLGCLDAHGYGVYKGKAHRTVYERLRGPIPHGYVLDHLCLTRACVNPFHLEAVTRSENTRRGNRPKERCINGHALTSETVYAYGWTKRRFCKVCTKERGSLYYYSGRSARGRQYGHGVTA